VDAVTPASSAMPADASAAAVNERFMTTSFGVRRTW
jgi:hypothetical protein